MLPRSCQIAATVAAAVLIDCGYEVRILSLRSNLANKKESSHCVAVYRMGGILWIYDVNIGTFEIGKFSKYNWKTKPLVIAKKRYIKIISAKWKTSIL